MKLTPTEQILSDILKGQHEEIIRFSSTQFYCVDSYQEELVGITGMQQIQHLITQYPNVDVYEMIQSHDDSYESHDFYYLIKNDIGNYIGICTVRLSFHLEQVVVFLDDVQYDSIDDLIKDYLTQYYGVVSFTKKAHRTCRLVI